MARYILATITTISTIPAAHNRIQPRGEGIRRHFIAARYGTFPDASRLEIVADPSTIPPCPSSTNSFTVTGTHPNRRSECCLKPSITSP